MSHQWPTRWADSDADPEARRLLAAVMKESLTATRREMLRRQVGARLRTSASAKHATPFRWVWVAALGCAAGLVAWLRMTPPPAVGPTAPLGVARVVRVAGRAQVHVQRRWIDAALGQVLPLPSQLQVDASSGAEVRLPRGVTISASGDSQLTLDADAVAIDRGEAWFDVAPGRGRFQVDLGARRVVVLGTRFWVASRDGGAAVCVQEGRVRIEEAGVARTLAVGQGWRSAFSAPSFPAEQPCRETNLTSSAAAFPDVRPSRRVPVAPRVRPVPPAPPGADDPCAHAPDLERCYQSRSSGDDLAAQNALYRLGLVRAAAGSPSGALQAWRTYQRRFPAGPLLAEVDLSILELRLRQGAEGQALREATAFLDRHGSDERAAEVVALRGVLHQRRDDCRSALRDYDAALAAGVSGGRREEALFGQASCLQTLADPAARRAYRRVLEQFSNGRFREDAEQALRALGESTPREEATP